MNNLVDLVIIGAGPAGLMTAKTAAEIGLKVVLIEKQKNFKHLKRACSAQFIMDDGYENEFMKIKDGKLLFTKNNFEVNYQGTLVDVSHKYYFSPKGHRIHFALPDESPFAVKFDKRKLIEDLLNECEALGVTLMMSTLAYGGTDFGDHVKVKLKTGNTRHEIEAKKVVIAEGVNARLAGIFGMNQDRNLFATAHVVKYFLKGVTGIEPKSWNLFYGQSYHSNAAVIIGPSIYGDDVVEMTLSGSAKLKPNTIFENVTKKSPIKDKFTNAEVIDVHGCCVKAYNSLKTPYLGNVLVIGDGAAFVEVEVQGGFMCGYHAAHAIEKELKGENGFLQYTNWWKDAFEFNSDEYLQVSQGYALVPTYSDDELDYLFSLIENNILEGTYSQYRTPKLIWNSILEYKDQIQLEKPNLFEKIQKNNTMTLTDTF